MLAEAFMRRSDGANDVLQVCAIQQLECFWCGASAHPYGRMMERETYFSRKPV